MRREVTDPEVDPEQSRDAEELRILQLHGDRKRQVEAVENRDLGEHRQAPAHRVHLVFPVELECLLLQPLRVALVLVAERVYLRLQRLHRLHRPHALHGQRVEEHARHHGQQDDREAVVPDVLVDPVHQQQDGHAEPPHRNRRCWHALDLAGQGETPEVYGALKPAGA